MKNVATVSSASDGAVEEKRYYCIRPLSKIAGYARPYTLRDQLEWYGFLDGQWLTARGRKFGRYRSGRTNFNTEWLPSVLDEIRMLQETSAPRWDPDD